jgi:hypothetical protein
MLHTCPRPTTFPSPCPVNVILYACNTLYRWVIGRYQYDRADGGYVVSYGVTLYVSIVIPVLWTTIMMREWVLTLLQYGVHTPTIVVAYVDNDVETSLKRATANEKGACGVPGANCFYLRFAVVTDLLPSGICDWIVSVVTGATLSYFLNVHKAMLYYSK